MIKYTLSRGASESLEHATECKECRQDLILALREGINAFDFYDYVVKDCQHQNKEV